MKKLLYTQMGNKSNSEKHAWIIFPFLVIHTYTMDIDFI